jgi:hypothetical protein
MARGVRQRIGLSAELGFWNGREKAQKAQKNVGLVKVRGCLIRCHKSRNEKFMIAGAAGTQLSLAGLEAGKVPLVPGRKCR